MKKIGRTAQAAIIVSLVLSCGAGLLVGCLTAQGTIDTDATAEALDRYGPVAEELLRQYWLLRRIEATAPVDELAEIRGIIGDIISFADTAIPPTKKTINPRSKKIDKLVAAAKLWTNPECEGECEGEGETQGVGT